MDSLTQPISNNASLETGSVEALTGNVDAIMASSRIWTSGYQAISQTIAASAQAQLERNLTTWKAMTGVKSIKEAMDLQAHLTRTLLETILAETGKLAEASMSLAKQTMVPMTTRMTVAAEQFSPPPTRE